MERKEYPEEGELVVCTAKNVKNFGAFVTLDEYNDKEGFIHIAEIATGWVKRISNHIKGNQKVVCKVMDLDKAKGHIDLSLKRVNEHQKREKIQEWKNAQKAEKLMERIAKKLDKPLEECYTEFGNELIKRYGSLYGAFEEAAYNIDTLKEDGFEGKWLEEFEKTANDNITIPFVEIKGYIKINSWLPEGVKHIKNALTKAEETKYEDVEIETKYIGAPYYMITVNAPDYKVAEDQLKEARERAGRYIEDNKGEIEFHRELEE